MTTGEYANKILKAKTVRAVCKLSHDWAIETGTPDAEVFDVDRNDPSYEFFYGVDALATFREVAIALAS